MNEITVTELKKIKENKEDFQLIDVREPSEYDAANLQGELIPLSTIPQNQDKISKDKKVVIMCRSGNRSGQAVRFLENLGFSNLYNLKGGILAYKAEIDPTLRVS